MVDPIRPMPQWLEDVWLARYLDGELSPDESAGFEVYCFGRDRLMAQLDADSDLRDLLCANADAFDAVETPGAVATSTPRRPRALPKFFALAASLVCGLVAGGMTGPWGSPSDGLDVNPTRLVFDTMRGTDDGVSVDHASSRSRLVLLDIAVPLDATETSLTVDGEPGRALDMSGDGFVSALLPREMLRTNKALGIEFRQGEAIVRRRLTLPPQWESP